MSESSSGAHVLLRAAHAAGVRICFANPGTTELAVVRALNLVPGIRAVLGLFEGVCTGAADGYARIARQPALTLLHLGPGFANGLANLHNARRAHSPIVNVVGDHATWHLAFDAPLTSDIESLAQPMSGVTLRLGPNDSIAQCTLSAVRHSLRPPGQTVTLIAPDDLMQGAAPDRADADSEAHATGARAVPSERIEKIARRLENGAPLAILLGHDTLAERGQRAAARVAAVSGGRLLMESYPAVVELGGNTPTPRAPGLFSAGRTHPDRQCHGRSCRSARANQLFWLSRTAKRPGLARSSDHVVGARRGRRARPRTIERASATQGGGRAFGASRTVDCDASARGSADAGRSCGGARRAIAGRCHRFSGRLDLRRAVSPGCPSGSPAFGDDEHRWRHRTRNSVCGGCRVCASRRPRRVPPV